MAPRRKSTIFRVTGLDSSRTDEALDTELRTAIGENLSEQEKVEINVVTTVVPYCYDDEGKVVLVEFQGAAPQFLSELLDGPLKNWEIEMGDVDARFDASFDRDFFGFTQLYATTPGESVTAE